MNIFLTGSAGFVGSHLVKHLQVQGHDVVCHAKQNSHQQNFSGKRQASSIDLFDSFALQQVLQGIDTVIHCAAMVTPWGREADFFRHHVLLTQHLLQTAAQAGVKQFIYLSCASVALRHWHALLNINESAPLTKLTELAYSRSKGVAEELVLAASSAKLRTIALRPALIWGRGDIVDRQLGVAAEKGQFAWFNQGDYVFSTCYIENLTHAISCALSCDLSGEAFFISDGAALRFRDFMTERLRRGGFPVQQFSLATPLARALARFTENGWKYLPMKGKPPLTREMVRLMGYPFTLDTNKALQYLGYQPKYHINEALEKLSRVYT